MQAISISTNSTPSITEQARRQQIVQAAVASIADVGYGKTSFARIAERAGLSSTGLISYHFRGKRQLDAAIAAFVLEDLGAWMYQHMSGAADPPAALESYIRSLIGYMQERPSHLAAFADLVLHGALEWESGDQTQATSALVDILRQGHKSGQFRPFDVDVMANTIQRSLDGIPFLQRANPDLDLDAYAAELVELFRRATMAGEVTA